MQRAGNVDEIQSELNNISRKDVKNEKKIKKRLKRVLMSYFLLLLVITLLVALLILTSQLQSQTALSDKENELKFNRMKEEKARGWWLRASNGFYYRHFSHEKVDYATAKSRCEKFRAKLAAKGLRNATLRIEIRKTLPTSVPSTWIGMDDLVEQGIYVWNDNVTSTQNNTDWHSGEPSSALERCGSLWADYRVNDEFCTTRLNYLCEFGS